MIEIQVQRCHTFTTDFHLTVTFKVCDSQDFGLALEKDGITQRHIPLDIFTLSVVLAVPWLRWLVAGLSQRRPGFDPESVHVGFVVDKVALGQVSLRVLRFSPVSFIPSVLH